MNQALLAQLNDTERLLWHETDPTRLANLDEDATAELHDRIRRARNKHTGQYRREASARVAETRARGAARARNTRNAARAEAFEVALSRVSRRLSQLSRQAAAELRAERIAAAKANHGAGPAGVAAGVQAESAPPDTGVARRHRKTTGGTKRDASSQSAGARRQARRDDR
jgi:hypothetical protein